MFGNWSMAVLSVVCFGSFAWAVKGHFRSRGPVSNGMRLISVASLASMAWFLKRLLVAHMASRWPLAAALIVVALGLFWWTVRTTARRRLTLAFDDDQPTFLHRHGPYRWVRHPFYASYILFWLASSLATPGLLPWAVPVCFVAIYIVAATKEEGKFETSSLGMEYARYRSETGMLLPFRWRWPKD
ncbi:MAG: methyltransferase family protein [Janthinobacterium lividum]